MRSLLNDIFYSFPIQLFILHFRKYQVLLVFWLVLWSTISSNFMKSYGADALFFTPEYLGVVNFLGALIVGLALGVFIMSWNITTFILHSRRFKFLATTSNPFLKYCINNAVLPLLFFIVYFINLYQFDEYKELMAPSDIFAIMGGILLGVILLIAISFAYFFGAGKTIVRTMAPIIKNPVLFRKTFSRREKVQDDFGLKVSFFFTGRLKLKKPRQVGHYRQDFIDIIFKRHHLAAIASVTLAFFFLVFVGFMLDNKYFQMPAAASILIFFAIMIALIGALTYFLQSWSLLVAIILLWGMNILFKNDIIDPRNKAYGLQYSEPDKRPDYNKAAMQNLCSAANIEADRQNMIGILEAWKSRQAEPRPKMVFINVSGGGLRSAAFTMNALQQIDSISHGGLMKHCFLISGASGGMLAAAYYRELYRKYNADSSFNLHSKQFTEDIAGDLLNPVFSSMIARDVFAPGQKFSVGPYRYVKDRGYAFEQKLAANTNYLLDIQLKDVAADEKAAKIPLIIFNAVIKSDGRKLVIGTQPMRFMMKPYSMAGDSTASPDAIDFTSLFSAQQPLNLRMLTALRMNATFPYVLPNVWLPSDPVTDVMDAGLRDNYGQETTLRFIDNFKDWIQENTGGVFIIQLRDRLNDNWHQPFETTSLGDMIITPATMLQHNWYKLQDYFQADQFSYFKNSMDSSLDKITIMYYPEKEDKSAALNFHLSAREKRDVIQSFYHPYNVRAMQQIAAWLNY